MTRSLGIAAARRAGVQCSPESRLASFPWPGPLPPAGWAPTVAVSNIAMTEAMMIPVPATEGLTSMSDFSCHD